MVLLVVELRVWTLAIFRKLIQGVEPQKDFIKQVSYKSIKILIQAVILLKTIKLNKWILDLPLKIIKKHHKINTTNRLINSSIIHQCMIIRISREFLISK